MEFQKELNRVASEYARQGYEVIIQPGNSDLPAFAKDFNIDILARRGEQGALVQVKQNRQTFAADSESPRYAEIIGAQPGWRYDFVILEAENPMVREVQGALEPSDEEINKAMSDASKLLETGYVHPALVTAWSGLEAAMRKRVRAEGQMADWESSPKELLNELYSSGIISTTEFPLLERGLRSRNEIVHGFAAPNVEADHVRFLIDLAQRLMQESQLAEQSA